MLSFHVCGSRFKFLNGFVMCSAIAMALFSLSFSLSLFLSFSLSLSKSTLSIVCRLPFRCDLNFLNPVVESTNPQNINEINSHRIISEPGPKCLLTRMSRIIPKSLFPPLLLLLLHFTALQCIKFQFAFIHLCSMEQLEGIQTLWRFFSLSLSLSLSLSEQPSDWARVEHKLASIFDLIIVWFNIDIIARVTNFPVHYINIIEINSHKMLSRKWNDLVWNNWSKSWFPPPVLFLFLWHNNDFLFSLSLFFYFIFSFSNLTRVVICTEIDASILSLFHFPPTWIETWSQFWSKLRETLKERSYEKVWK